MIELSSLFAAFLDNFLISSFPAFLLRLRFLLFASMSFMCVDAFSTNSLKVTVFRCNNGLIKSPRALMVLCLGAVSMLPRRRLAAVACSVVRSVCITRNR